MESILKICEVKTISEKVRNLKCGKLMPSKLRRVKNDKKRHQERRLKKKRSRFLNLVTVQ